VEEALADPFELEEALAGPHRAKSSLLVRKFRSCSSCSPNSPVTSGEGRILGPGQIKTEKKMQKTCHTQAKKMPALMMLLD
jgi:hypothetical protein